MAASVPIEPERSHVWIMLFDRSLWITQEMLASFRKSPLLRGNFAPYIGLRVRRKHRRIGQSSNSRGTTASTPLVSGLEIVLVTLRQERVRRLQDSLEPASMGLCVGVRP